MFAAWPLRQERYRSSSEQSSSSQEFAAPSPSLEFSPMSVDDTDELGGAPRPRMPTLPLHLLKDDRAQSSSMGSQASLHSVCSWDRPAMSCGGGGGGGTGSAMSDAGSSVSFALEGSPAADLPMQMRSTPIPAVPACFKCKLRQQVMEDPVRLPDGSVCERASAATLHPNSAVTSDPLFAEAIGCYLELRRESERQQREWQAWVAERTRRAHEKLSQRQRQIIALRVALEQSRKKARALEEKALLSGCKLSSMSATSSGSSSQLGEACSDVAEPSDQGSSPSGPEPLWRSGPAPRSEAATPATRRASERRRSTWSYISGRA